jgi:hypothetical protein
MLKIGFWSGAIDRGEPMVIGHITNWRLRLTLMSLWSGPGYFILTILASSTNDSDLLDLKELRSKENKNSKNGCLKLSTGNKESTKLRNYE